MAHGMEQQVSTPPAPTRGAVTAEQVATYCTILSSLCVRDGCAHLFDDLVQCVTKGRKSGVARYGNTTAKPCLLRVA